MADMGRDYEERPYRDVIADMLAAWQGDDAGVYAMADQLANKLRAEGYVITEASECKVCGEDIAPFCIVHGFDGRGVGLYVREALTEDYGKQGVADEIRNAVAEAVPVMKGAAPTDDQCRCGHPQGLHDSQGLCAAECRCFSFRRAPIDSAPVCTCGGHDCRQNWPDSTR